MSLALGIAVAGEDDVDAGAALGAGAAVDDRIVDALNVAVHQRGHGLRLRLRLRCCCSGSVLVTGFSIVCCRITHLTLFAIALLLLSSGNAVGRTQIHVGPHVVSCHGNQPQVILIFLLGIPLKGRRGASRVSLRCAKLLLAVACILVWLPFVIVGGGLWLGFWYGLQFRFWTRLQCAVARVVPGGRRGRLVNLGRPEWRGWGGFYGPEGW